MAMIYLFRASLGPLLIVCASTVAVWPPQDAQDVTENGGSPGRTISRMIIG